MGFGWDSGGIRAGPFPRHARAPVPFTPSSPSDALTCRFVTIADGPLMFSTAPRRTFSASYTVHADVAQLVAHNLAKVGVAGSNPVVRSRGWTQPSRWSGRVVRQRPAKPCTRVRFPSPPRAISSAGERFPDTEEVTGSIPVSRTISRSTEKFTTCGPGHRPGPHVVVRQAGRSRLAPEIIARRVDSVRDSPIPIAQSRMPALSQSRKVAVRCPISC